MATLGSSPLDGPPPSPAIGPQPIPSMGGMAPPIPAPGLPPEVLTGILAAGEKISSTLDAFAQVTPDLANDWDMIKTMLQRSLGKVMMAGGGATSPTAAGPNYPGGVSPGGGSPGMIG